MIKVKVTLPGTWINSIRGQGMMPIDRIEEFVKKAYNGSVDTASEQSIVFRLNEDINEETLTSSIARMLAESYSSDSGIISILLDVQILPSDNSDPPESKDGGSEFAFQPLVKQEKKAEEEKEEEPFVFQEIRKQPQQAVDKDGPDGSDGPDAETFLKEIRGLVGCDALRELCEELHAMAPSLREKKLTHVATEQNYLFSIDSGYGSSTMAELFQQFMLADGLLEKTKDSDWHTEIKIIVPQSEEQSLRRQAGLLMREIGNVTLVDISAWCDKLTDPDFRDFLSLLHKLDHLKIYVFMVPYLERSALRKAQEALSDVMRVRLLEFPPLSMDQLREYAANRLSEAGYTVDEDAWSLFSDRIALEKADGRFYGMNTINKIVSEMLYLQIRSELAGQAGEENVITGSSLLGLAERRKNLETVTAESLFSELVGIDKIRDKIYEVVNQIEFARKNSKVKSPSMHMRFVGSPGTGKTTVARIVGLLLKERGVLSKGEFFEHAGGDFIGMYVGHTVPKTMALCRDAYGSVLFIDEAYTLADSDYNGGSGFAREAVDALIAQMENHREDLMVIMAGYPDEMQRLMELNPGLEGRMPYLLEFPNYDRDELEKIFLHFVQQGAFELEEGLTEEIHRYFSSLPDSLIQSKDFSNARFVRNLYENTWGKAVTRERMGEGSASILTAIDFNAACRETASSGNPKKNRRSTIGFHI